MNIFKYFTKYRGHPEAVIISCFFNPMNSAYRLKAFRTFYESIKHLNHQIVECVIGDGKPQLTDIPCLEVIRSESLLWHKEALLNGIIAKLPKRYKYVFWIDADVIFTNRNWLVEGVEQLKTATIIQPFEYCVHLQRDENKPSFDMEAARRTATFTTLRHPSVWRSFCANCSDEPRRAELHNYDLHGHVGFAWGARRQILDEVPLYDRALIGGADHIIAHAAAGHIPHECIRKAFSADIENVEEWSHKFFYQIVGRIGYVKGDLYHLWHGDINKRQYLKRIQDFTSTAKSIQTKDENGLYVRKNDQYMHRYFAQREVQDDGFLKSMALGYMTDSPIMGGILGGNFMGGVVGAELRDIGGHDMSPDWHGTNDPIPVNNPAPEIHHTNDVSNVSTNFS